MGIGREEEEGTVALRQLLFLRFFHVFFTLLGPTVRSSGEFGKLQIYPGLAFKEPKYLPTPTPLIRAITIKV